MELLTVSTTLALISGIGPIELTVILVIALLLFGKRLPEVMKSMGRGVVEFKKGIRGIEDDIDTNTQQPRSVEGPTESDPKRE